MNSRSLALISILLPFLFGIAACGGEEDAAPVVEEDVSEPGCLNSDDCEGDLV